MGFIDPALRLFVGSQKALTLDVIAQAFLQRLRSFLIKNPQDVNREGFVAESVNERSDMRAAHRSHYVFD